MNKKRQPPSFVGKIRWSMASVLSLVLVAALCSYPLQAQNPMPRFSSTQASPAADQANAQNADANAQPSQPQAPGQTPKPSGTTVNPSQPPLQPVTTYPDAGNAQQPLPDSPTPQTTLSGQQPAPPAEPQGAATAERVPTVGGAAARPAGAAIAPAKQHQVRSLLIKLGAVAAGAVAGGAVYGLSRATPSLPPGANSPSAIKK